MIVKGVKIGKDGEGGDDDDDDDGCDEDHDDKRRCTIRKNLSSSPSKYFQLPSGQRNDKFFWMYFN